jgi:coproporphyrinogen III oxidase-like Fe-S oxidoreductase
MDSLRLVDAVHRYFHVGPCNLPCSYCGCLGFVGKKRSKTANSRHYGTLCCRQGKIMLDEIPPLPPTLHHLFTSVDDPLAKHFHKKDSALQFRDGHGIFQNK